MSNVNQRAFDVIYKHLLTQNEKSLQSDPGSLDGQLCAYRGAEGRRCAVGAIIADEYYVSSLEDLKADSPLVRKAIEKSGYGDVSCEFLCACQTIHDISFVHEWKDRLGRLAKHYDLTVPEMS